MPPRFVVDAPRCPRCNDRVYAAEKVLGPGAKEYHKLCLKCVVCNKLLDSVSLLEHDDEPYCNNCHRTHLGQGRNTFGTAVPLHPSVPSDVKKSTRGTTGSEPSTPTPVVRRPLPVTPAGGASPLPLPSSQRMESPGSRRSVASPGSGASAQPSPSHMSGTPLCARCHKAVCTCCPTHQILPSSAKRQDANGIAHVSGVTDARRRWMQARCWMAPRNCCKTGCRIRGAACAMQR